jgi:leucyl aminopeptidase (aminopeptidase T)
MRNSVRALQRDHELSMAAQRVVQGALALAAGERLAIVVDEAGVAFGALVSEAAGELGASSALFVLETLGPRPHHVLHASVRDMLPNAQASMLHVRFHAGELPMRAELVDLAATLRLRHAHLVGITRTSLVNGLAVDPRRIAELSRALRIRIRSDSLLSVRSGSGTDLTVRLEPWCRWYETSGVIRAGTKANLPAGELVTSPAEVTGVYVADGFVGDGGGTTAENLSEAPMRLEIDRGIVRRLDGGPAGLGDRLLRVVKDTPNLERVGLVSFGTNVGMIALADDVFTNQKLPSFHLSLGQPFPERTGATWRAMDWIAFTATGSDVDVDGAPLMRAGRYLIG